MTFKSATWYPISLVLSGLNLVAVGFAAVAAEPWHATLHATLAVGFGLWAQRLRPRAGESELSARVEALEGDVQVLRQELGEAQERLDFAERLLAQVADPRRVDPQR
jgi:hypothetical protein